MLNDFFPEAGLLAEVSAEKEREKFVLAIREKYNGKIVMELFPNLQGKPLGLFMKNFQEEFADYERELYGASAEEIRDLLRKFYENNKS